MKLLFSSTLFLLFAIIQRVDSFSCTKFCSSELPILIVGGGLSGVAAAHILHKSNCSFHLLEAREFLGGRLQTHISDEGDLLHFGANWIHGTGLNPLWVLNQEQRIVRTQWLPKSYYVRSRSGIQTFVGNSSFVPGSDIREDFTEFYFQHAHVKDYIASVAKGSYAVPDLPSTWFTQEYISGRNLSSQQIDDLYLFEMAYQTMDEAIEPAMVGFSALLNNKFYGTDNEEMVAEPGYTAFIDLLSKSIPPQAVHLSTVVTKIAYDEQGVYVTAIHDGNPILYTGAVVIITVPLGVLQFDSIEFSLPLPPWKRIAIDRTHMGLLDKVWLKWKLPWWPVQFDAMWAPKIEEYFAKSTACEWYNLFNLNLEAPNKTWPAMLLCTPGGIHAEELQDLDDNALEEYLLQDLKRIFPNVTIPKPTRLFRRNWRKDPFARGSYSVPLLNSDPLNFDYLAAPVADRMFFGGEHTSLELRYGYADAAYNSGLREGGRVLSLCPSKESPDVPLAPVGYGLRPPNDAEIRKSWVDRVLDALD